MAFTVQQVGVDGQRANLLECTSEGGYIEEKTRGSHWLPENLYPELQGSNSGNNVGVVRLEHLGRV